MKKAVVVGASGYVGRNLIRHLISNDIHVLAVYRSSIPKEFSVSDMIDTHQCNLENLGNLADLYKGEEFDVLYQLAWEGAKGAKREDYKAQANNAVNTVNAVDVAIKLGCKKFITVGTISERLLESEHNKKCFAQNMVYAATKAYTHHLLSIIGNNKPIKIIWAQLSNIYGGDDNSGNLISYALTSIQNGEIPEFGPCNNPYDFIHIDDVASALFQLGFSETSYDEYFIGRCEGKKLKEYVETVATMYKGKVQIGARPDDGLRYSESWFDNSRLVHDLHFQFKYTFEQGLLADKRYEV